MEKEKVTQTPDLYALLYLYKVCGPETLQKQHSGQSHAHLICIATENSIQTCGRQEAKVAVGGRRGPIFMSHT